jgi:capsular polysaccharide biosynthesis protein
VSSQRVKARRVQRGAARNGRPLQAAQESAPPPRPELKRVAAICVAIVAIAAASAVLVGGRGPTVYGGRSDVLVVPSPAAPLDVRDRDLATQRDIILSRAVLVPVAASNATTAEALRAKVSVQAAVRNDLMHITVGDRRRARALGLTRAVTAQYLKVAGDVADGSSRAGRRLDREMARLTARAARASGSEALIIRSRVQRMQDRRLDLDGQNQLTARLLSAPYVLAQPLAPKPLRALAAGLVLGLVLAAVAAALLVRRAGGWPSS